MSGVRRFACTQCGKCCNRSPEVELSEAAALADVFVFRLMFRLYRMPRVPERGDAGSVDFFYQKKRLLVAHAARKYPKRVMRGGRLVELSHYLMISALALDTTPGACAALGESRCNIHDRRPVGCRTVPFHYSRADGLAESDFDAFVATPGYRCDTSEGAAPFIEDGRVVDMETVQARADALVLSERDRPWKEAIVRRMKSADAHGLPTLQHMEANAGFAAMTTSMRIGWDIAVDAEILELRTCRSLIEKQLATIERELGRDDGTAAERDTLREMRIEYQLALPAT
jgi:Fe-S-cluster containining protein